MYVVGANIGSEKIVKIKRLLQKPRTKNRVEFVSRTSPGIMLLLRLFKAQFKLSKNMLGTKV